MISKQMRKLLVAIGVVSVGALPAMGQKQAPPAGGPPRAFTLPAHESYALPNGMKVTLVPYGNIPKVTLGLVVRAGGIDEAKEQLGVADLTGDLLKEGTTSLSATGVAEAAARMGSTLGVGVTADETVAEMDVLSEFGPDASKLLAEVAQHPLMPESELARLKTDMLRQIAVAKSQPGQIAL